MALDAAARRRLGREVAAVFLGTTATLALLDALSLRVGAVGEWAPLVAAALFVGVPLFVLERWRRVEPNTAGITAYTHRRAALLWTALSVGALCALFPVGFYVWHGAVMGLEAKPALSNYLRWSPESEQRPRDLSQPGVYVWTQDTTLLTWCERSPSAQIRLQSTPNNALTPQQSRGLTAQPTENGFLMVCPQSGRGGVDWTFSSDAPAFGVFVSAKVEGAPLFIGANTTPIQSDQAADLEASWTWILWLIATQIVLVAVPEEFFYRGYIQPALLQLSTHENQTRRIVWVIVLTSALFALGHVLVYWHWTRLMVFFPSLAFGFLRQRTGGIFAPAMFHAACNCAVELTRVHYF